MTTPSQPSTEQTLRAENAELRARLQEAEEMLRAIRSGEEPVRERTHLLDRTAQLTPGVLQVFDLVEKRGVFINRTVESVLGYSPEEVLAMGAEVVQGLMHPGDLPRFEAHMARMRALPDGEIADFEFRMRDHAGEWRWFQSHDSVFARDAAGAVRQIIGVATDITERQRIVDELRSRTHFLERIAQVSPAVLGVFDLAEKRVVFINRAVESLIGYTREEMHAMADGAVPSLMHPEDLPGIEEHHNQMLTLADGDVAAYQYRMRDRAGEWRWFQSHDSVFARDAAGAVRQIIGVATDITERQRIVDELRSRTHFLERIAQVSPGVLNLYDLAEKRAVFINRAVESLIGYTLEEMHAMADGGVPSLMHPEDLPRLEENINHLLTLADGEVAAYEYRMRDRAGEWHWFHVQSAVFEREPTGTARKVISVATDISERKRMELNLTLAIAAAEQANHAKTRFLASMSHELRTPLNAILGFGQLMDSDSPARTLADKRSVDQILKAGWYLLELINEILDLSLIESGQATISPEPIALAAVMLECQAMVEADAKKAGLGITFPPSDIPYVVTSDRTRLQQILVNFLTNAVKYNKPGGTISVECAPSPPDSVRISVRDTGDGMSPEQLARLFEPFNRLGKEGGGIAGTGIGLVVVKRLIELLGGTIGVESTVGVGSVFWIELRLAAATRLATQNTGSALLAGLQETGSAPQRTLLYVEDNPGNLQLVEEIIARRPDLRLLSAADGSIGIAFAHIHQPDVILMDINLPGINGIEAMKILRADLSTAHIPVIALSANAMTQDVEKALAAGFFSYLTKPIKVNQLLQELDVALNFAQTTPRRAGRMEQA